jgi:26S proteasome regulatory subunit N8
VPTTAYLSIENAPEQQSVALRTFSHIPSSVGAYEAEEVGVEHLVRVQFIFDCCATCAM